MLGMLLFALTLLVSGCLASIQGPISSPVMIPTRPDLTSLEERPDSGITMDKRDAGELLIYIETLERAVRGAR